MPEHRENNDPTQDSAADADGATYPSSGVNVLPSNMEWQTHPGPANTGGVPDERLAGLVNRFLSFFNHQQNEATNQVSISDEAASLPIETFSKEGRFAWSMSCETCRKKGLTARCILPVLATTETRTVCTQCLGSNGECVYNILSAAKWEKVKDKRADQIPSDIKYHTLRFVPYTEGAVIHENTQDDHPKLVLPYPVIQNEAIGLPIASFVSGHCGFSPLRWEGESSTRLA